MNKKIVVAAFVALVVVGAYFWNVSMPMVTVAEKQSDIPIEVFGLGNVEAKIVSEIGFEVGGKLTELHVDARDKVKQGQLLAALDESEQQAELEKAESAMHQSESAVSKAEADVEKAKAVLEEKTATHERKQTLVKSGAISKEAADIAKRDANVAAAELKQAESNLEVAKGALNSSISHRDAEQVKLKQHKLYAPYDGMVMERKKELGSVLAKGEVLFTIVDPTTRWGKMYIDESRAGGIEVGKPARVKLRSMPDTILNAEVVRVDVESDRVNEERVVYVKCLQCPSTFYLGEQAEVWVHVDTLKSAFLVPEKIVEAYDGSRGDIWVVEGGKLAKKTVEFHPKTLDGMLPVATEFTNDTRVVISDVSGLKEGKKVRAIVQENSK